LVATRVITGLVLGTVITATVLFLPTIAAVPILGVFWLAGSWEWAGLARWQAPARCGYVGVFAALMLATLYWTLPSAALNAALTLALVGWLLALLGILTYPRPIASSTVSVAGFVALLPAWLVLAPIHGSAPSGPALMLVAFALVWAADVGAYCVGRWIGRIKLAPRVSPGKTWEGVGGGLLLAIVVAWLASYLVDLSAQLLVIVAVVTALVSVLGDLTVSMLKRNVGVKDSGHLLPGHGGVMDRIDGLTAALPFFAIVLKLAGVIS